MAHKPWREISTKDRKSPERVARIKSETRSMLAISALTRLRESRSLTQAQLAKELDVSQSRVSRIENQDDLNLSTLDEVVRGLGGELRISVVFPDETVELLGSEAGVSEGTEERQPGVRIATVPGDSQRDHS
jgi:transcriptional regulator with XRE-family HTH domain